MELNKTKCNDCGHLNRWHSYKWANTAERQEHNRKNSRECPKCGSTNVSNVEDDDTMGPYRGLASLFAPVDDRTRLTQAEAHEAEKLLAGYPFERNELPDLPAEKLMERLRSGEATDAERRVARSRVKNVIGG